MKQRVSFRLNLRAMFYIDSKWLKCRHQNGASLKGIACDCTGLITGIYADRGLVIPVETGYSAFWFTKKGCPELMLPYLEKYFERADEPEEGCCISYRFGRSSYAHLSLYLGEGLIIHCNADFGVEIIRREELLDRESGIWRLKCQYLEKITSQPEPNN